MTIAHVQSGGTNANSATSVSRAFGSNVSVGSLVVVVGLKFSPTQDNFAAGDCTQSAGTATLGTISFDGSRNQSDSGGAFMHVGIWSAIVTGAGSCTMQVGGALAGSYLLIGTVELSGSWDSTRAEATNSNGSSTASQTTGHSGDATSAGAALFVGALQLNSTVGTTITQDGAFSLIYENETGTDDNGSIIYRIVSGATTDRGEWTFGSTNNGWAAAIVAYKEAAGGGGGYNLAWIRG